MKTCIGCTNENTRPRAPRCLKCEKKYQHVLFMSKHKEKFNKYHKLYRKEHAEEIKQRIKKSQTKNPDLYKDLQFKHYLKRHSLPETYVPKKKNKKGEGNINKQGYRRISIGPHPNAQSSGIILEHVYVISKHLGRPLAKGETVHHINGDRLDNRIENLELWSNSHPPGQRVDDKIKWAIEFLCQYGYQVTTSALQIE